MIVPSIHKVASIYLDGYQILHTCLQLLRKDSADWQKTIMRKIVSICFLVCSKMYRQFSVSFAFELTPGQWSRCAENRTSAFGEFQQHLVRDMILNSLGLFSSLDCHFFSEPGPTNDHCPIPNFFANMETTLEFATHSSSLPLPSQEMSLNIDIKRILPVKVSGASSNLLRRSVTLPQSCNVVNPGKMFHSTSVGSPFIPFWKVP